MTINNDKTTMYFFSHDVFPRSDKKILKLFTNMGAEGYGLFWLIIEFMHLNDFSIEDENILAYDFRVDVEKIHRIMTEFDLFRIEEGYYVSDRVQRNIAHKEDSSEQGRNAANIRWLLSTFDKEYENIFGKKPVLDQDEIKVLKSYSQKIPNFKDMIPDILFTLKNLKFDNDINFKPCADWLLTKNNLGKLVNGEFGPLKHKKTPAELKAEAAAKKRAEQELNSPGELELKINSIINKTDAISLISEHRKRYKTKTIVPPLKALMKKFDITQKEIDEYEVRNEKI